LLLLLLQEGRVREQKIKLLHGDTLIINTMEGNCMMNFFKRFIAGGFQVRPKSEEDAVQMISHRVA
jgi:hypothetical protein